MTDDLADFTEWRDRIESLVSTLEAAIGIQKGLRAAMDEDSSKVQAEFRAQRGLLQALHDTQQEHTTLLRAHSARLSEHSGQLTELRAGQQRILVGVEAILGLLNRNLNGGV
jgi:septal ring factor EnvC (AmiA/AmiB activator)